MGLAQGEASVKDYKPIMSFGEDVARTYEQNEEQSSNQFKG